ncbi:hypothetical protein IFO70_01570 [Phormidium tenue FACHB-886]|nr:hypothetical protein [Phormidium tenue FACHB-886]
MKPTLSWSEYQRLELIPASVRRNPSLHDRLIYHWQQLIQAWTKPSEIEVWSTSDAADTEWWSGYDPQTGRSLEHVSEIEIRRWIEQRYSC